MSAAHEFPPQQIRDVVVDVARLLKEKGETVSVAETAAGGIISASILSTPGASGIYKGGLTLYTLESRIAFGKTILIFPFFSSRLKAGWTPSTIQSYRGPTPQVVEGLAVNIREKLGTLAVATEKGCFTKEVETGLGGDREANMVAFAVEALGFLREVVRGEGKL
ncbi:competence damage-inducible protein [Rutstroemia sp. NJR-2017a BBW]|nr:competence damage-inducible protein [Rutstroemia sp. NJR-2017a BBW]